MKTADMTDERWGWALERNPEVWTRPIRLMQTPLAGSERLSSRTPTSGAFTCQSPLHLRQLSRLRKHSCHQQRRQ
jgi:hypothetical protein